MADLAVFQGRTRYLVPHRAPAKAWGKPADRRLCNPLALPTERHRAVLGAAVGGGEASPVWAYPARSGGRFDGRHPDSRHQALPCLHRQPPAGHRGIHRPVGAAAAAGFSPARAGGKAPRGQARGAHRGAGRRPPPQLPARPGAGVWIFLWRLGDFVFG